MQTTHEVVGYTGRLPARVLLKFRDSESEGMGGYVESPSRWWKAQTPFDAGGWTNQIEQSTRGSHVENRQDGRLCGAVKTAFPSAPAGDRYLPLKWRRLESWGVLVHEIDNRVGRFPLGRGEKCDYQSFRATGGVLESAAGHRWGPPPSVPGIDSLEKRGHHHRPYVSEKSDRGSGNRERHRPCSRPLRGEIGGEERRGQGLGNARG
jgi:hypothetical protein